LQGSGNTDVVLPKVVGKHVLHRGIVVDHENP
jgi:hypothetical protein